MNSLFENIRKNYKKLFFQLMIIALFKPNNIYGQGKLFEIYPTIPRVDYNGVYFFNADTGFAVGAKGVVIKTTNGGKSWKQKLTPVTTILMKIRAFSESNIFICGLYGTLLHSTDKGETWNAIDLGTSSHLISIKFIDNQTGWICGFDSTLFKTENGGATWERITTSFEGDYRDIDFYNFQIGYICGDKGFLVTTNSGKTWTEKSIQWLNTVEPLTENILLAGNIPGDILYSTDRGATWSKRNDTYASDIQSIEMVNDTLGYASGRSSGGYYFTTDAGKTWDFEAEKIGNSQISFINDSVGYGVGSNLTLTKTTDKGKTWKRLIINEGINAIYFINENQGFLSAEMIYSFENLKQLYYSSDGGSNWSAYGKIENFSNRAIESIFFKDTQIGFIGASGDAIYKTTNAGKNWVMSDSINLGKGWVRKFVFIKNYGWALLNGYYQGSVIKKTSNNGDTWKVMTEFNSIELKSIFFLDDQHGWITGISYFAKTTDGGTSWVKDTKLNYSTYNDVYFSDLNNGWLTVDSNRTIKTTDGGRIWEITPLRGGKFIEAGNNNVYLTSSKGLYYSSNKGKDWIIKLDSTNAIPLSTITKTGFGWGVVNRETIYQYFDTTLVPVELTSFGGENAGDKIILKWQTTSELNNKGFNIEKSFNKKAWSAIGFVDGKGTTTNMSYYSFIDGNISGIRQFYRLKQIGYDGSYNYSKIIELNSSVNKLSFSLSQNYPNPFNPETNINYSIPETSHVRLKLYDITGKVVKELVNETKQPGYYTIKLKGGELSSGCISTSWKLTKVIMPSKNL